MSPQGVTHKDAAYRKVVAEVDWRVVCVFLCTFHFDLIINFFSLSLSLSGIRCSKDSPPHLPCRRTATLTIKGKRLLRIFCSLSIHWEEILHEGLGNSFTDLAVAGSEQLQRAEWWRQWLEQCTVLETMLSLHWTSGHSLRWLVPPAESTSGLLCNTGLQFCPGLCLIHSYAEKNTFNSNFYSSLKINCSIIGHAVTDSRHNLQYGPWFKYISMSQRLYFISTDEGSFIQLNLWDVLRLLRLLQWFLKGFFR